MGGGALGNQQKGGNLNKQAENRPVWESLCEKPGLCWTLLTFKALSVGQDYRSCASLVSELRTGLSSLDFGFTNNPGRARDNVQLQGPQEPCREGLAHPHPTYDNHTALCTSTYRTFSTSCTFPMMSIIVFSTESLYSL